MCGLSVQGSEYVSVFSLAADDEGLPRGIDGDQTVDVSMREVVRRWIPGGTQNLKDKDRQHDRETTQPYSRQGGGAVDGVRGLVSFSISFGLP